ncbi:MAG: NAD(P)H-dependent oxidoreductase [Saprospiraceae bacterium]
MTDIFVIIGSASTHSSNEMIIDHIKNLSKDNLRLIIFKELKSLPHFDPELALENPPKSVLEFRKNIEESVGVIICTPEYVFSIPSGLKNAIEWCVSTTVFSDKITGIITASSSGQKGHAELQLIMKTIMAKLSDETNLLIQGVKGKINKDGEITDPLTTDLLKSFTKAFIKLVTVKYA